jgi:hypothetical protein
MLLVAMSLLIAPPAGALAAGESSGRLAATESGPESPADPAEPAAPAAPEDTSPGTTAPPSTGWVPQGGSEASGDGSAGVRHGSSLGSGGPDPKPAAPAPKESSPSPGSSGDQGESAAPAPAIPRQVASAPRRTSAPREPAPAPVRTEKPTVGAVATATLLSRPDPPRDDAAGFGPSTVVSPVAQPSDQGGSGADALLWLAALVLAYAGWRLAVYLRLRLAKRRLQEECRRQDEEWEATMRQIQLSQVGQVPKADGGQPRRLKVAPDLEPSAVGTGEAVRQASRPARAHQHQ